jgi:hypothetical protein
MPFPFRVLLSHTGGEESYISLWMRQILYCTHWSFSGTLLRSGNVHLLHVSTSVVWRHATRPVTCSVTTDCMLHDSVAADGILNPWNAALNPVCHLLALLGAHHILHVCSIRVNITITLTCWWLCIRPARQPTQLIGTESWVRGWECASYSIQSVVTGLHVVKWR